jgi:hypothetical protein
MSLTDQQIKDALRNNSLDQPGIIEMAASNFRGRNLFVSIFTTIVSLAILAAMVWCAMRFFQATAVRDMILYAILFMYGSLAVGMLKLWFWLMMIRYSIVREVKRVELQVSMLAERMESR